MDILLSLKDGIPVQTILSCIKPDSTVVAEALALLGERRVSENDLCDYIAKRDGQEFLPYLFFVLNQWKCQGWIDFTVCLNGKLLAKVIPSNAYFRFPGGQFILATGFQLSRFVWIRRDGSELMLESAFLDAQILLEDPNGALIFASFVTPTSIETALAKAGGVPAEEGMAWIEVLARLGIIDPWHEPESNGLATWEFHDALFHQLTRSKSIVRKSGATLRFRGKLDPLPAVKPVVSTQIIELKRPAMDQPMRTEPFGHVLDRRKSIRARATVPMRLDLLSQFLHQVAAVRRIIDGPPNETLARPFPAGGAIHEIEFYLAIDSCDELSRGLYHYNGVDHTLAVLPAAEYQLQALLDAAALSWGENHAPQILIILAARFGRMAWNYERIAYRTTLLNAGVVIQTMYLVATALELAPCALGLGDSDLFERAAGLDPLAESSVAEFGLSMGSRAPG